MGQSQDTHYQTLGLYSLSKWVCLSVSVNIITYPLSSLYNLRKLTIMTIQFVYLTVDRELLVIDNHTHAQIARTHTRTHTHIIHSIAIKWPSFWKRHFHIFLFENCCILILISVKYTRMVSIDSKPSLGKIMTWPRTGDKPLSQQIMA